METHDTDQIVIGLRVKRLAPELSAGTNSASLPSTYHLSLSPFLTLEVDLMNDHGQIFQENLLSLSLSLPLSVSRARALCFHLLGKCQLNESYKLISSEAKVTQY